MARRVGPGPGDERFGAGGKIAELAFRTDDLDAGLATVAEIVAAQDIAGGVGAL